MTQTSLSPHYTHLLTFILLTCPRPRMPSATSDHIHSNHDGQKGNNPSTRPQIPKRPRSDLTFPILPSVLPFLIITTTVSHMWQPLRATDYLRRRAVFLPHSNTHSLFTFCLPPTRRGCESGLGPTSRGRERLACKLHYCRSSDDG